MGSRGTRRKGEAPSQQEAGKPRYASLKGWMKKEFRAIRDALSQGQMPDPGLAGSFVDDCLLMCAYPGKGDEYYSEFQALTREFAAAVAAGDLAAARSAAGRLAALKHDCHDRHKPPKA